MSKQRVDKQNRPARSTARRVAPTLIVATLIVAGGIVWYLRGGSDDGIPRVDLSVAEPSVALRIREASDTVRSEPSSQAAWGRLGIIFEVHGYVPEAVTCYERAQSLNPSNPHWPYFLGICRRVGDNEAATRDFQRAAELKPDYAPLQVNLAEAFARLDRFDEAEACYRRAAELDPDCAPAHSGLGRIALARGEVQQAAEHLEQALRLAPQYQQAHRLLAQAYRQLGETAAAQREWKLAERGNSDAPLRDRIRNSLWSREGVSLKWRTRRADHYLKQGREDDALAEWQQALHDDPTLAQAHLEIGVLHTHAGRNAEAVAAFEAALRVDPDLSAARSNLGGMLLMTGRIDEGVEQLRLAADAMPDHIEAQFNYGVGLQRANRPQSAVDVFRKVVEAEPNRPGAYDHLGIALTRLGRFAEAIAAFKTGIKALPDEFAMANRLAWLLATCPQEDCRDAKQAVALATHLCAVDGFKSPLLLDTLAAAQAQAGEFDAAVRTAEQAIDLIGETDVDGRTRLYNRLHGLRARLELYKLGRPHHGPR